MRLLGGMKPLRIALGIPLATVAALVTLSACGSTEVTPAAPASCAEALDRADDMLAGTDRMLEKAADARDAMHANEPGAEAAAVAAQVDATTAYEGAVRDYWAAADLCRATR